MLSSSTVTSKKRGIKTSSPERKRCGAFAVQAGEHDDGLTNSRLDRFPKELESVTLAEVVVEQVDEVVLEAGGGDGNDTVGEVVQPEAVALFARLRQPLGLRGGVHSSVGLAEAGRVRIESPRNPGRFNAYSVWTCRCHGQPPYWDCSLPRGCFAVRLALSCNLDNVSSRALHPINPFLDALSGVRSLIAPSVPDAFSIIDFILPGSGVALRPLRSNGF